MNGIGITLIAIPVGLGLYAYLLYPACLWLLVRLRPHPPRPAGFTSWPAITISLPAYNEEASIGATIESLLALDYPAERRQIIVISDASTDRTDDIVRGFSGHGVELLRLSERRGKTAAENAAVAAYRGEIIVNTDATIRIPTSALKPLVAVFADPDIGVASGRDISVGDLTGEGNRGESGYTGYEMTVRALETRVGSIVGASGCFYAIRRHLVDGSFPEGMSRDFGSALLARESGFRAVSVDEAVCLVPRTRLLRTEFRRKTRTMARGLSTLYYKRHLLNPVRHGVFAWMLLSHKLIRWLAFPALPLAAVGVVILGLQVGHLVPALMLPAVCVLTAVLAFRWPADRPIPLAISLPGFVTLSTVAAIVAWVKVLRGEQDPIWEPTRRPVVTT